MRNTEKPVLCVGVTPALQRTLCFDELRIDAVNRASSVTVTAAGKGVNVARVLRTLDVSVRYAGFLGGNTGREIQREVESLGVECVCTSVTVPTRICQTLVNRRTGEITELVEEASCPSADAWEAFMGGYREALHNARLAVISGTLMPGAPADLYIDLATLATAADVPVLIDSHGAPLLRALAAKPWLVKLNADELISTCETAIDDEPALIEAARTLLQAGARAVLVTRGGEPSLLVESDSVWICQPPRIQVINPIGSGDAVTAGIAYAHIRGDLMADAIRFGTACGAANALTSLPGHINREDLPQLLAETQLLHRP